MLLRNVLLLAALGGSALASIGPVTDLHIVNKVISPDGFSRDSVLAEGTFPGPLIKGNKGDNFQINVIDQLVNETLLTATSIHWHGLFQHTTAWADGPAFVTQCPITANHSFLYNFTVPDQAGTFWYHSHFATQYCDGLRGPLVVYDPEDPHKDLYDIDDDSTVITLGDWYHIPAVDQGVIPTTADSTLINGLGRWPEDPTSELAVIEVKHGKRYRFRLVNVACESFYNFTIDGHDMTVIEADGINTEPRKADFLSIFVGQRYSFVLEANQPVDNYWIHADPNRGNTTGFANGINSAILRYKGAPIEEPTSNQTAPAAPLHEFDLHPLDNAPAPGQPFPGGVDFALNLALGTNDNQTLFTVNGAIYQSPSVPILLQILSGNSNAQDLLPAGSIYGLPSNSTIEISIPGGLVVGPHPFHLHGHAFSVVRSAGSTEYNYENPIRRDVVSIGDSTDNVTIRFVTDNPGPWFLHCHIDWHLRDGLAVVFAEDTPNIQATNPAPDAWKQLCPIYDASISGSN